MEFIKKGKEKCKNIWYEHKDWIKPVGGAILACGLTVAAAVLVDKKISGRTDDKINETVQEAWEETFDEYGLPTLGNGDPIYKDGDESVIYEDAFENDEVRKDFEEKGYTIVEREA